MYDDHRIDYVGWSWEPDETLDFQTMKKQNNNKLDWPESSVEKALAQYVSINWNWI